MPKTAIPTLQTEAPIIHPVLGCRLDGYDYSMIGDTGGLTQFGAHIEVLHPGSTSSLRHWHKTEDKMIYLLAGEVVLVKELENRSDADAQYLTIGTRNSTDTVHYSDHNIITHKDLAARHHSQDDSSPYSERTLK